MITELNPQHLRESIEAYDHGRCSDVPSASIALGAGGSRGIAHLGVMEAIGQSNVSVDHLSGISIGAIAAALCALEPDIHRVQAESLSFLSSPDFQRRQTQMFGTTPAQGYGSSPASWVKRFKKLVSAHQNVSRALRGLSILPESVMQRTVDSLFPDIGIEEARMPLTIVALDLLSGSRVELSRGSLRDAVRASASIPGVFPPVQWDDMLLCDVGPIEAVPTETAKRKAANMTIAVDVSDNVKPMESCSNILQLYGRIQQLGEHQLRGHSLSQADLVIQPPIGRRAWFDFESPEHLIELGRQSAATQLANGF